MEQFAGNVIDYFEDTYIVDIAEQSLFDVALWNMYDQTIGDLLRTNNAVEGSHRRFQANVGTYHPNFWKFIDILKREQGLNHVNISQARAGHQPEPQRRRYQAQGMHSPRLYTGISIRYFWVNNFREIRYFWVRIFQR